MTLNEYAVDARYPGEYVEPDQDEAEEALRIASNMYEIALRKL